MKTELVQSLTTNFEAYAHQTDNGIGFWTACDDIKEIMKC